MVSETLVSDPVDPLSGFDGPSLFPRTMGASAAGPLLANSKDLDSINNFMKSLDLKSPAKPMSEAKRIVDGGMELLESNFVNYAENIGISDAGKDKDKLQERRQGLGITRKKGSFALRASVSQPSVTLESAPNIDQLEDPDEYFDAYDRAENARKEIQKQWGGGKENPNQYKPARSRRPGILGKNRKSFSLKPRYSSVPSENIDVWVTPQKSMVHENSAAPKDDLPEKLVGPDRRQNPDVDLEDVELDESVKKTNNEASDILDELLSCDIEDLDGDGASNLLKEWLKIKPLDMESLLVSEKHVFGQASVSSGGEGLLNEQRSSRMITTVLKNVNNQSSGEKVAQKAVNPFLSPTPPRSPSSSLSLLKKKILQPNPLKDPFSLDLSADPDSSPAQSNDNTHEQDILKDLSIPSVFESHVEVKIVEPTISNTESLKTLGTSDAVPAPSHDQVNALKNLSSPSVFKSQVEIEIIEPTISNTDSIKVVGNSDAVSARYVNENASLLEANADDGPCKISDCNSVETMNFEDLNDSQATPLCDESRNDPSNTEQFYAGQQPEVHTQLQNEKREAGDHVISSICSERKRLADQSKPSIPEDVVMDDGSRIPQIDPEQPQVHQAKKQRRTREVSENRDQGAHPMRKHLEDRSKTSVSENVFTDNQSGMQQIDPEQPEVLKAKQQRRKREMGENRLQRAHPMRKSLAEAGTSFETGVRRSKRIKMRPLEYWKGERFLYGRVDDSFKLIGIKYISPGKADGHLKVKPLFSESSEFKELLELAAKH